MGTDPSDFSTWELWSAVGVAFSCVVTFAAALRRRWFARLRGGFAAALTIALVGAGVITALLLGVWAYDEARRVVFNQVLEGLHGVANVAEGELDADVRVNVSRLANVADERLMKNLADHPEVAREDLAELKQYNHRLLQISVNDADGRRIFSSVATGGDGESANHVGAAYAVDGKPYVSDPYFSPAFGRYVLYIGVPVAPPAGGNGRPLGSMALRYDIQDRTRSLFDSARFGATGYAVLLDHDGRVLAHRDPQRVGHDLSAYPPVRAAAAGRSGWVVAPNQSGVPRLFAYRPLKSPATVNGRDMVLLTEMDVAEAMAPVKTLRIVLIAGAAVLCAAWAVLARLLARTLTRPLGDLLAAATKVRDGDLTVHAPVNGCDEINRFAEAFNQMVVGLRERDRVKQLFGRYVTTQVSEQVLKHGLKLGGERRQCSMLFADIRNFTTMAESMQPEQVVELLNEYFSEMVEAVVEQGGVLDKFIGDGMLAVFGSMTPDPKPEADHRRAAVTAGLRMKARLAKINGEREMRGQFPIHIGIGIHTAEVVVGHIGSRDRVEHTVIGDGVNTCSRVESMNKELGTTLLITEQTYEPISTAFECRAMPETKVKGKAKPLRVFEVLSARSAAAPQSPPPPPAIAA